MDGLVSFGNNRSYDDFRKQLSLQIKPTFDSIRDFCLSLDEKVVEDVRMHRVVFCKSISFRWFLDMEPQRDAIFLKIQKNRKEPSEKIIIKPNESLEVIKKLVLEAFNLIR